MSRTGDATDRTILVAGATGHQGGAVARSLLDRVAAEAGVEHFVSSGVAGSDRATGVPHFDSCDRIESNVRNFGLPYTFLRPVFFTQTFESFREQIRAGTLALPITEDTVHQVFDLENIGPVAARVFTDPDRYVGRSFELAGDEGTLAEMAGVFGDVVGTEVEPSYVSIERARETFGEESAAMCEWFVESGFDADVEAMNEEFGPLTTLPEYLEREGWNQESSEPALVTSWAQAVV